MGGILWPVRLSQLVRSICVLLVWVRSIAPAAGKFRAWLSRGSATVRPFHDLESFRCKSTTGFMWTYKVVRMLVSCYLHETSEFTSNRNVPRGLNSLNSSAGIHRRFPVGNRMDSAWYDIIAVPLFIAAVSRVVVK